MTKQDNRLTVPSEERTAVFWRGSERHLALLAAYIAEHKIFWGSVHLQIFHIKRQDRLHTNSNVGITSKPVKL
jgi:hypothetical protein